MAASQRDKVREEGMKVTIKNNLVDHKAIPHHFTLQVKVTIASVNKHLNPFSLRAVDFPASVVLMKFKRLLSFFKSF